MVPRSQLAPKKRVVEWRLDDSGAEDPCRLATHSAFSSLRLLVTTHTRDSQNKWRALSHYLAAHRGGLGSKRPLVRALRAGQPCPIHNSPNGPKRHANCVFHPCGLIRLRKLQRAGLPTDQSLPYATLPIYDCFSSDYNHMDKWLSPALGSTYLVLSHLAVFPT